MDTTVTFNWKELAIAVFVVASGIANAYFWYQLIAIERLGSITLFSLPIASLFLFAVCFSLLAILGKSTALGYAAVAAAFVGSFFFVTASSLVILLLLLTLLGGWWAFHRIQQESILSVSFRLSKILRQGLPLFFTTIAILISLFYFVGIVSREDSAIVPRSIFDISLPLLGGTLQGILPGFRPDATIDQLLVELLKTQLGDKVDISNLSSSQRGALLKEQRLALEKGFGISITGKERASDVLYALTNQKIEELVGSYKPYLPYLSAFGFFLTIKVLTLPLYFIALGLIWLVVQLLLAIGALKRETVTIEAERITL